MKSRIFESIPVIQPKRAKFDLSHEHKTTGNMGWLIPVLVKSTLPGESWRITPKMLLRLAPQLAPVMHECTATMHGFYVPERILSTAWNGYITGGEDGQSTDQQPIINVMDILRDADQDTDQYFNDRYGKGTLWDYFGFPPLTPAANHLDWVDQTQLTASPWLAYQSIWQWYYRDENIIDDDTMKQPIAGGSIAAGTFNDLYAIMRKRAWEKDPFTSALPWPQRGPDVLMPMEGNVDFTYLDASALFDTATGDPVATDQYVAGTDSGTGVGKTVRKTALSDAGSMVRIENIDEITFTNGSITVGDVRTALVLQHWFEASARGGARYEENTLVMFGTVIPDYRLQQPEYIGGLKTRINFSEVVSTAFATDGEANPLPQGTLSGHGIGIAEGQSMSYKCKEHGWILVILSIMPDTSYQQGIPSEFLMVDRFDRPWPQFVGLGEQEIKSKELYYNPKDATATNDAVFGYQQRYWQFKMQPGRTSGDFRDTLDFWTMTRIFSARPSLNADFVQADPTHRIFAVTDQEDHKLQMRIYFDISAIRPLPYFSVPGVAYV